MFGVIYSWKRIEYYAINGKNKIKKNYMFFFLYILKVTSKNKNWIMKIVTSKNEQMK